MPQSRICKSFILSTNIFCVLSILLTLGCTTTPYRYGGNYCTNNDAALKPGESQIVRGRRAPVIDAVGWIVGLPAKIIFLNHHVSNHDISPETELSIKQYLACNGMEKTKVRINEYDPGGEWHRLVDNKSVGAPIRYTVGTLSVVGYTLLPGRIFGWDEYNPFTNTINIYSDDSAIAVLQGGRAKDFAQREYKGTYAVARIVPGVGVWQDYKASNDAISYICENGNTESKKEGYRTIYPTFAFSATEPFSSLTSVPLVLPALAVGHVAGQVKAASIEEKEDPIKTESEALSTATPASYSAPIQ
jgi:hypothetical protein